MNNIINTIDFDLIHEQLAINVLNGFLLNQVKNLLTRDLKVSVTSKV